LLQAHSCVVDGALEIVILVMVSGQRLPQVGSLGNRRYVIILFSSWRSLLDGSTGELFELVENPDIMLSVHAEATENTSSSRVFVVGVWV